MKLREIFQDQICCDIYPHWDDDKYEPIVNCVADKTGFAPDWITFQLAEWSKKKDLSQITVEEAVRHLRALPVSAAAAEISGGQMPELRQSM